MGCLSKVLLLWGMIICDRVVLMLGLYLSHFQSSSVAHGLACLGRK